MKTVLFSFADDKVRDRVLKTLKDVADTMINNPPPGADVAQVKATGELILTTLSTARLDPSLRAEHERSVALFVSGRKMAEGQLADMRKRFQQECDSHKANVELKELKEGEWVTVQSRRLQQRVG